MFERFGGEGGGWRGWGWAGGAEGWVGNVLTGLAMGKMMV